MGELGDAIDGAHRIEAQGKFVPTTSQWRGWCQNDRQRRVRMRNAHGWSLLFRMGSRNGNTKPGRRRKSRLSHGASPACDIDLVAYGGKFPSERIPFVYT